MSFSFPTPSDALVSPRRPDLRAADPATVVGRARGQAYSIGQFALLWAHARPGERPEVFVELRAAARVYVEGMRAVVNAPGLARVLEPVAAQRDVAMAFAAEVGRHAGRDFVTLDRRAAIALAARSREEVFDALNEMVAALQAHLVDADRRRAAILSKRAQLLDRVLSDLEGIGRTARHVGVNAATEGEGMAGADGRVFRRLAEEVSAIALRLSVTGATARDALRRRDDAEGAEDRAGDGADPEATSAA